MDPVQSGEIVDQDPFNLHPIIPAGQAVDLAPDFQAAALLPADAEAGIKAQLQQS